MAEMAIFLIKLIVIYWIEIPCYSYNEVTTYKETRRVDGICYEIDKPCIDGADTLYLSMKEFKERKVPNAVFLNKNTVKAELFYNLKK